MMEFLLAALLLVGGGFIFTAGLGLLRFPDFYSRMQAPAKAATLGKILFMLALVLRFDDVGVTAYALFLLAFFYSTAPVAAHMIGRAAYRRRVPLWERTSVDELRGRLPPGD